MNASHTQSALRKFRFLDVESLDLSHHIAFRKVEVVGILLKIGGCNECSDSLANRFNL